MEPHLSNPKKRQKLWIHTSSWVAVNIDFPTLHSNSSDNSNSHIQSNLDNSHVHSKLENSHVLPHLENSNIPPNWKVS